MANFTAAINALVGERDRVFLVQVAERYKLPFEELSKLYPRRPSRPSRCLASTPRRPRRWRW
jgi:hypothetical protein